MSYEREMRWWGREKAPAHVLFGEVLVPLMKRWLGASHKEDVLVRAFAFVELLASHQSEEVSEIASQSILEPLTDDEDVLFAARPYLGPNSLRMVRKIGEFWGIDHARNLR